MAIERDTDDAVTPAPTAGAPDLDAWRAEAGACAPLDAAASPAPWFFDSYSSVHSEPLTREHSRIEATIPDDAADDDPAWATLPETLVCRVPCVAGDTGTAQGRADGAWVAAARTGWPRDAARVGMLAAEVARLAALESVAINHHDTCLGACGCGVCAWVKASMKEGAGK